MRKKTSKHFLLLACLVVCIKLSAQTTISGPTCVIPALAIQYNITGTWTNTSTVQICVKNGKLQTTGSTCYNGKPVSYIRVFWDNTGTNGSISLTSTDGNASQSVKITRMLKAGIIDAQSERQQIGYNSIPSTINCSPALWGTCDPVYSYQWQKSIDGVRWADLINETGKSLKISSTLTQSVFFRRKVTETKTTTVGFSNIAMVLVEGRKN